MTMPNTIAVVCEGPPDAPHAQRVLRRYGRAPRHPKWHLMPPPRAMDELDAVGFEPVWPRYGSAIQWRCRDCRLDIKRRLDHRYDYEYPPLSKVLERLRDNEIGEITARALDPLITLPTTD